MTSRYLASIMAVASLAGCSSCEKSHSDPPVTPAVAGIDDLSALLSPIAAQHGLPGLAAAVFDDNDIIALGATGVRKAGDPTGVGAEDKWHLGSDTKAMTATLVAVSVATGELDWKTTLADIFGSDGVHADYHGVTIEQLLTHRGGAPDDVPPDIWAEMWKPGDPRAQRLAAVRAMLARPPAAAPGSRFLYANAGYMMVGAALEVKVGRSWEDLVRERLFTPLGMGSCGFGAPAKAPSTVDHPWAHEVKDEKPVPIAPGPTSDNPPSLGPAGTVHCNLRDWGKFLRLHLRAARGESTPLLSAAIITKLHAPPPGGDYAFGWIVRDRPWGGGSVLTHDGSNTLFYATAWIAPKRNRILVAATNRGDAKAAAGVHAAVEPLIEKYVAQN